MDINFSRGSSGEEVLDSGDSEDEVVHQDKLLKTVLFWKRIHVSVAGSQWEGQDITILLHASQLLRKHCNLESTAGITCSC